MKEFRQNKIILSATILAVVLTQTSTNGVPIERYKSTLPGTTETTATATLAATRYRLDAAQSKFIAHALRGGLLWFKGHDHLVAARDFTGEAEITTDTINPASLLLVVKADSMAETNSVFTDQQKQIINKELREIVLLPAQYPEIIF